MEIALEATSSNENENDNDNENENKNEEYFGTGRSFLEAENHPSPICRLFCGFMSTERESGDVGCWRKSPETEEAVQV